MKSSEVSIKTRSTPALLTIQGQVTKDTTVKWPIAFPFDPVPEFQEILVEWIAPRVQVTFHKPLLYC